MDRDSDFLGYLELWRYLREQQRARGSSQFRKMCQAELLHHLRIREWQDLHAQLRQIARGIGLEVGPLAEPTDRDGVHAALLSGLLSHVGMWDDDKREYRGARETRFVLAGGTALANRRPKWVMAAELVETDRLRARTVAQINPDRIEQVAGHVATRGHGEPWWDRERGMAMVAERVSLYGLPIVRDRRIALDRIDAAGAREAFIRQALVAGDWDASHDFLRANHERVVEVLALEHRVRRDLLVPDEVLAEFFDERLPAGITSGRRFDRWWQREQRRRPDLLSYPAALLVDPAGGPVDPAEFPEWWRVGSLDLPVTYTDDPTSELDGVTVDVPLLLLDEVAQAGLDWQVPGLRLDLVTALVRALPKPVRRALGPAREAARAVLAEVGPSDGRLLDALPGALAPHAGEAVRLTADDLEQVPGHLRVTYRAVDRDDRPVAWSKDLDALRAQVAEHRRAALAAAAPQVESAGLRSWTIGALPQQVQLEHAGQEVTGYPALVDEGETVAVRVLATQAEQRRAMWAGTRRLLLLGIGSPLRTIDRSLPNAAKLAIATSDRATAAEVYRDGAAAAVAVLLADLGGPVWDDAAFGQLLTGVRAGFAPLAAETVATAGEVLAAATAIDRRLATMISAALDDTVVDVRAQLDRLLAPGFVARTGARRLPDVARYVRAIEHRLEKAANDPAA